MFDLHTLVAFVVAGLLLALTPGPDVLYIVARSTSQGRAAGVMSALGVGAGLLVHIAAATCGLSALMMTLPAAYDLVRWIGAAYLVWLGVRTLAQKQNTLEVRGLAAQSLARVFWQGALCNVLNPKVALFFLAFLPQFTDATRGPLAVQFFVLGFVFAFNGTLVNLGWALAASRLGDWLRARLGVAQWLNRTTGGVFIALGVKLALAERR